jgi:hypothetical protein
MSVPIKNPIVASLTAQERFAQSINQDEPEQAMFSYQDFMHQHAMQQFEYANRNQHPKIDGTRAPLLKNDSASSVASTASVLE